MFLIYRNAIFVRHCEILVNFTETRRPQSFTIIANDSSFSEEIAYIRSWQVISIQWNKKQSISTENLFIFIDGQVDYRRYVFFLCYKVIHIANFLTKKIDFTKSIDILSSYETSINKGNSF